MHNYGPVFSSPAPGFVMGVGSVGKTLAPYEEGNTYMSTDAGLTWSMVHEGAYQYEFGDSGSVIGIVDDENPTGSIMYSMYVGRKRYVFAPCRSLCVRVCDLTETPCSIGTRTMLGSDFVPRA